MMRTALQLVIVMSQYYAFLTPARRSASHVDRAPDEGG